MLKDWHLWQPLLRAFCWLYQSSPNLVKPDGINSSLNYNKRHFSTTAQDKTSYSQGMPTTLNSLDHEVAYCSQEQQIETLTLKAKRNTWVYQRIAPTVLSKDLRTFLTAFRIRRHTRWIIFEKLFESKQLKMAKYNITSRLHMFQLFK